MANCLALDNTYKSNITLGQVTNLPGTSFEVDMNQIFYNENVLTLFLMPAYAHISQWIY